MTTMLACKSRHHQEYHSSTVQMPIRPILMGHSVGTGVEFSRVTDK